MKQTACLLLAFILFLFITKPLGSTRACGWGPEEFFYGYSFFDPAMTEQPDYSPFFMSFDRFYDLDWNDKEFKRRDNISEWQHFFKDKPRTSDIAHIVYKESPDNLIEAKKFVEKKSNSLPDSLKENTLVKYWKQKKMSSPICYLVYAKQLEPHVVFEWDSWDEPTQDLAAMEALIGEGVERYDACKNQFLKMRYGYQIVRLAHYAGKYEECIKFHDELVEPLKDKVNSQIYYWSLGHKAGALKSQEKRIEASYLYSIVFENCPAKRAPVWLSFSINDDEEWEACLALCKTEEEKANLYFLRAINPVSQVVEEMENIYQINPKSEKLDILLAREINKLEYDLFGYEYNFTMPLKEAYEGRTKEKSLAYLTSLRSFVKKRNNEKKLNSPNLWKIAEGYLAFMESDFSTAKTIFKQIEAENKGEILASYAELFQWVTAVSELRNVSLETEEKLWSQLQTIDFKEDTHTIRQKADRYLQNVFARLYGLQGDIGKAFLCTRDLHLLHIRPSTELADDMLAWMDELDKRKPTDFEKHLLQKISAEDQRSFILEVKGTMAMKEGNIAEAVAIYEQIPEDTRKILPYFRLGWNPFEAQINDCLDCVEDEVGEYDKLSFAKKILELIDEAEKKPELAANNYFLVGNAFYNMTFFGHAWSASGYFRSGSYWASIGADPEHWAYQELDHLNLDMETADKWYQKAIDFSEGDKELAAEATFMASKCEQNRFFLAGYNHDEHLDIKTSQFRSRFDELIDDYSETAYYQEVIKECHFLSNYKWLKAQN